MSAVSFGRPSLRAGFSASVIFGCGGPSAPPGYVLLRGADGSYLKGADGAYLYGKAT